MSHTHYRLTLELSVPDAIAPDRVLRLLRDIPVPGTPIRCIVVPVPATTASGARVPSPAGRTAPAATATSQGPVTGARRLRLVPAGVTEVSR
jgi:hypothetical protein